MCGQRMELLKGIRGTRGNTLLEYGIQMLVYAGEYDFICNWLGKIRIPILLEWNHEFQLCWNHRS